MIATRKFNVFNADCRNGLYVFVILTDEKICEISWYFRDRLRRHSRQKRRLWRLYFGFKHKGDALFAGRLPFLFCFKKVVVVSVAFAPLDFLNRQIFLVNTNLLQIYYNFYKCIIQLFRKMDKVGIKHERNK